MDTPGAPEDTDALIEDLKGRAEEVVGELNHDESLKRKGRDHQRAARGARDRPAP
jgi:uncharacterized protein YjbJ (UPF0337 family)